MKSKENEKNQEQSRSFPVLHATYHLFQMISLLCFSLVAFTTCVRAQQSLFEPRIIGGSEADYGRYSYAVRLESTDDDGNTFFCGGSLIARDAILTAAHCNDPPVTAVIVGRHDMNDDNGQVFYPVDRDVHPLSVVFEPGIDNDVMLLFLDGATAEDVVTVRLNSDPSVPYVGQDLTVVGWGDTDARPGDEFNFQSDVLMNAGVTVISNEECDASEGVGELEYYQAYKNVVTETMLCTTASPAGFCFGDSGGPLVVSGNDAGSDVQVGIVSWLVGCATETELPTAFARVSHFYEWIQSEVCKRTRDYASEAGFDCSVESDGITPPVNPCRICPDGFTEDEYDKPNDWWPLSCREAMDKAALYETGSYECALLSQFEIDCCPPTVEDPCTICQDGADYGDEFKPFKYFDEYRTCESLIAYAAGFEIDSDYCNIIGERHELYCCHPTTYYPPLTGSPPTDFQTTFPTDSDSSPPTDFQTTFPTDWDSSPPTDFQTTFPTDWDSSPPTDLQTTFPTDWDSSEAPCAVCDGLFRPDMLVPFENLNGVTCEDIVLDSSVDCFSRQYAQALCCPSAASTCSICKGTQLSADAEVTDGTGITWTCREVAYYAANHEPSSTECTYYHSFEEYCCPDVFEFIPSASSISNRPKGVSCKVCDDDVRENMPIPGADGMTCEDVVAHAETIDETSDDCPVLQVTEALCCPSAASTCSICKGTKLLADVEVVDSATGESLTCGEVALNVAAEDDANSADCETYQAFEEYCCPVNYYATSRTSSVTNPTSFTFINTSSHTYTSEALVRIFSTTPSSDTDTESSKEETIFTRPTTLEEAAPSKISSESVAVLAVTTSSLIALTTAVIMSYDVAFS